MEPTSVSIDGQDVSTLTLDAYNWNTQLGSDVFLYYDDGAWGYLEDGTGNEMSWITRLKLKAVSDVQVSKIDWSETSAVSLPAVETRSAPAPAMAKPAMAEPTSGPVRGLW
jgi:hypothetical protein